MGWSASDGRAPKYTARRSGDEELRERLRQLAGERRRFGYRRLHVMLVREGQTLNHKRVYRLYQEEGLSVRKRARKRVSREARIPLAVPSGPNQLWSLDFVADTLSWGRKIRMLTVVDATGPVVVFTVSAAEPLRWPGRARSPRA